MKGAKKNLQKMALLLGLALVFLLIPVSRTNSSSVTYAAGKTVKAKKITLNKTICTLKKGAKVTLRATITPKNATQKTIQWKTSSSKIATVTQKGVVRAKNKGKCTITAVVKGTKKKATCKIIVGTPISKITPKNKAVALTVAQKHTLKVTIAPSGATTKKLTYISSNPTIATVSEKGVITAKKVGKTVIAITATDGTGKKATVTVTVKNPVVVSKVSMNSEIVTVKVGATTTLVPTVLPSNAANKKVTYSSDKTSVAKVDANGVVTGVAAGRANITITSVAVPSVKTTVGIRVQYKTKDTQTYTEESENSGEWFGKAAPGDYYVDADQVIETYIDKTVKIPSGENVFDVRDYGAVGDGETLCTNAFSRAVSAAFNYKGSGDKIVLVAGGDYCSGTINLYSNITLFIATDASIQGSKNVNNYNGQLIKANGAKNVTITGGGTIWGNGEFFVGFPTKETGEADWQLPHTEALDFVNVGTLRTTYRACIRGLKLNWIRPGGVLGFYNCSNLAVKNIVIGSSTGWTFTIENTDGATVDNIVMNNNRHIANADGIDICSSKNVTITNSFISTADDGIVIKAHPWGTYNVENITVKNCEVMSVMNCFKIGTETYRDISHVTVEDCHFFLTDIYPGACSGISIESADGSKVSDVTCRNITMENVSCPIFICLNNRNKYKNDASATVNKDWAGTISGVTIENVTATDAEAPSIITGSSNVDLLSAATKWVLVQDVTIKNFNVTYRDSSNAVNLESMLPEYKVIKDGSATFYPENNSIGDVPAYGLYIRHANSITLEDINVTPRFAETRDMITFAE
jgi:polygalacturonase/uncharacterized protein YjdB